ncbi:MAG: iron-regulated protein frpC, partial [Pseudomonadota bacterium]
MANTARNPINGDDGNNKLIGTKDDDIINGFGGNDRMWGLAGDDYMSGGDGRDLMRGGDDDDIIVGNKGDDWMLGEDGDDRLVWNNGDGSDVMRGGKGFDATQVNFFTDLVNNDIDNDDTARIETAGKGISFARTELNGQTEAGLFALDIAQVEALEVNFGKGHDTAELVGDVVSNILMLLDGGKGVDTLDLSELSEGAKVELDVDEENAVDLDGNPLNQPGLVTVGHDITVLNDFENVIGTEFEDQI